MIGRMTSWLDTAFHFEAGAPEHEGRLRVWLVQLLCVLVGAATALSLLGWLLVGMDGLVLLTGSPFPAMKFSSALMLLALGILAWSLQEPQRWSHRQVFTLAGLVWLLALGHLLHLFPSAATPAEIGLWSRTTEGTALICASLALAVMASRSAHHWAATLLAALAGAIAYATLLAYVASGGRYLAEVGKFAHISPQTALAGFALAVAIGLCGSSGFISRLWRSRSNGRFLISLGFPFIYALPLLLAWVIGQGQQELPGQGYLIPLLLTLFTFILAATKLFSAYQIYQSEGGMRVMLEHAESLAQTKTEFLANMSHEIRTPLNAILGLTRLFRLNTPLNLKQEHYVDKIERASDLLLNIINDILDFSKLESGQLQMEQRPFELDGVFVSLEEMFAARAEEKGLQLQLEIDEDVPQGLSGDSLRLSQVFINLVGNALKFTEQGQVRISARLLRHFPGGVELAFAVQDSGVGITPKAQARLFQSFSQGDSSTTRRFGGSGLGLVICKRLVELMGGRIWLESEPGVGSTFHFTCSFGLCPVANPGVEGAAYRRRVLVADDEPVARLLLVRQLRKLGHEVVETDCGEGALALALERNFDVLFLDWRMPDLDGIEVAVRLRSRLRGRMRETTMPPVVLVSGAQESDASQCAQAEGVVLAGYIAKPVTARSLRATFSRIFSPTQRNARLGNAGRRLRSDLQVLLVEDNHFNQEVMRETLAHIKAQVKVANHGQEALEWLARQPFDLVLMDVQMPVMDGLEATRAIRAQPRFAALPIIGLTANALQGDREICLAAGMSDYLPKPVDLDALLRRINTLVPSGSGMPVAEDPILVPDLPGDPHSLVQLVDRLGELPCLNLAPALERVRSSRSQYVKFLQLFLRQGAAIMEDLQRAGKSGNLTALQGQAHALKGSAGMIGATLVHARAAALEQLIRTKDNPAYEAHLAALADSWLETHGRVRPLIEQSPYRN